MNKISEVYQSLQRKKSIESEAERLGMSIDDYVTTKDLITETLRESKEEVSAFIERLIKGEGLPETATIEEFKSKVTEIHENVAEGTSKITGLSAVEPKSAEEIIEILKIDTSKWKLSQYWNKEKHDKWLVSALVTRIKESEQAPFDFLEALSTTKFPVFEPLEFENIVKNEEEESVCGVISMQDLHFGKLDNENIEQVMTDAVKYLMNKAYSNYHLEKVVFIIGGDLLNMDTFSGTTTKGTLVDNGMTAVDTYLLAFKTVCEVLRIMRMFTSELEVVYIPGNHDRLSSFHLLHAVSQAFTKEPGITFHVDYKERRAITYGKNFFGVEHGDVTAKNNPLVYATEFYKEWGNTIYRTLYTGHYHFGKTKEYITENGENGFVTKVIPALTASDYYHEHNKYIGSRRSALIHLHDKDKGLVSEFTYSV